MIHNNQLYELLPKDFVFDVKNEVEFLEVKRLLSDDFILRFDVYAFVVDRLLTSVYYFTPHSESSEINAVIHELGLVQCRLPQFDKQINDCIKSNVRAIIENLPAGPIDTSDPFAISAAFFNIDTLWKDSPFQLKYPDFIIAWIYALTHKYIEVRNTFRTADYKRKHYDAYFDKARTRQLTLNLPFYEDCKQQKR